jgi:hypothetical protein
VVNFTPLLLYPKLKSPRYSLDRRLGGLQSRLGRCGEEENLALPGIEPVEEKYLMSLPDVEPQFLRLPVCSLFIVSTMLRRYNWKQSA